MGWERTAPEATSVAHHVDAVSLLPHRSSLQCPLLLLMADGDVWRVVVCARENFGVFAWSSFCCPQSCQGQGGRHEDMQRALA
mmetsp:Transcript_42156/g.105263  ORF Transcript_42156/g.105263 Transcript_42156/m.105263 type:complete len:83 (-) Transcript_42156:312-560(-)